MELGEDHFKEEKAGPSQANGALFQSELKNDKGDEQADAERRVVTGLQECAQGFELCFCPTLVLNSVPEVGDKLER